jgi:hypothetical protein
LPIICHNKDISALYWFQTSYFSENLVAPGIKLGLMDVKPGTLTTRPQRRSVCKYSKNKSRVEYSEIMEAALLLCPFCSPTNCCSTILIDRSLQHNSKSS